MALTLRDVVESQTQMRASGARRDAAQRQETADGSRERFSLEATDRRDAAEARFRSTSARAEALKAQAAKAEPSRPKEQSPPADRSSASKSEPDRVVRPETSKRPATTPSQPGKPEATAAPQEPNAETSPAVAGQSESMAGQSEDGEKAAATKPPEPNAFAVMVAPAYVAPPPPTRPIAGTSVEAGDAVPDSEAAGGTTDAVASQTTKIAAPAGPAAATKPAFDMLLADVSAASASSANAQPAAASSAEPAAVGGQATAPSAAMEKPAASPHVPAASPSPAPVPLGAVPMTIGLRALGASSRFEIRLDPKELGRVDVSIDIDKDTGTVGARLVVDRPETLALLQRDASSLQQALAQTGLDASAGVSLSLRDGQGEGQRNGGEPGANAQARAASSNERDGRQVGTEQSSIDLLPLRALRGLGRVDIRI